MNYRAILRRVLFVVTVLLLLVFAGGAIIGATRQVPRSRTPGQRIETVVQFVSGVLTLLLALTAVWRRRWASRVRLAWGISVAMVAGLSSVVWGPPMLLVTAVFLAGAVLASGLVVLALNVGLGGGQTASGAHRPSGD